MNLLKTALAGAASAVGTHFADEAVNASPYDKKVYYGVGAAGLAGALWFRNSSPIVAGLLLGVGAGSIYQGYTRPSVTVGLAGLLPLLSAESLSAPPRIRLGIPITRRSIAVASNGRMAIDGRAFNPKIAPYGVSQDGYPLAKPWPYGLDADRFAKPRPPQVDSAIPQDIKGYVDQGIKAGKDITDLINNMPSFSV